MNRRSFLSLLGLAPVALTLPLAARKAEPASEPLTRKWYRMIRATHKHSFLTGYCYHETFEDVSTGKRYHFMHVWDQSRFSWTPGHPAEISRMTDKGFVPVENLTWDRSRHTEMLSWTERAL